MREATFTKVSSTPGLLTTEAAGLAWLEEAGGAPVVRCVSVSEEELVLSRISESHHVSRETLREFGARLFKTHKAGADAFGVGPPGTPLPHGFLGPTNDPLKMPYADCETWAEYFAEYQLMHFASIAKRRNALDARSCALVERLAQLLRTSSRLDEWVDAAPSRIHGDLWSGNVMWSADAGGTLIDPAARGGAGSEDIALLHLFGCRGLADIVEGYYNGDGRAPVRPNCDMIALLQLPCVIVHAILFGECYAGQAAETALRLTRALGTND